MWSDEQELAKAMDAIWSNFFHFVEDFIMLALHFRVLDGKFSMFRKEEPLTSPKSSWAVMTKADGDALIKKLGAIFRSPLGLEMVDSLAAAKSFENVRLFRATAFWNDQEDVLADGFRRREPEEFRGAEIPRGDDAIRLLLTMHRRRIQQSPPRARADR